MTASELELDPSSFPALQLKKLPTDSGETSHETKRRMAARLKTVLASLASLVSVVKNYDVLAGGASTVTADKSAARKRCVKRLQ